MRLRNPFLAAVLLILPAALAAQAPAPPLPAPTVVLPEPSDDAAPLKIINSQNAAAFKELIAVEMQPLFREGQLEIEAANRLQIPLQYGETWNKASSGPKSNVLNGSLLRSGVKVGDEFLFGNLKSLESEDDPKLLAQKVLWNIYSVWASGRAFNSKFDFHWFKETAKPFRSLRGEFARVYPALLGEPKHAAQLFRELIRFTTPAFLNDLSWLTFRFLGPDEDVLWVFSPAVKKLRQLTATNRSDSILRSAVSPEDFLVWSGKPETVQAQVESSVVALAPFPRSNVPAMRAGNCLNVDRAAAVGNRSAVRWNFESSRFPQGAGWVPSTSIFVPRAMWRIEFSSQDPFSVYGRQVMYVDQELMLPLYKFVYDRSGRLWKTVIGSYGLAGTDDVDARLPYPAYSIIVDNIKHETFIMDFSYVSICSTVTTELNLSNFDPKRFSDTAKISSPPAAPTSSPQLPTEEIDER